MMLNINDYIILIVRKFLGNNMGWEQREVILFNRTAHSLSMNLRMEIRVIVLSLDKIFRYKTI